MKMSYNKELDYVLKQLLLAYSGEGFEFKGFVDQFAQEDKTTLAKVKAALRLKYESKTWQQNIILEQLLIDKHITSIEPLEISLKGAVFIGGGGYRWQSVKNGISITFKVVSSIALLITGALGCYFAYGQYSMKKEETKQAPQTESRLKVVEVGNQKTDQKIDFIYSRLDSLDGKVLKLKIQTAQKKPKAVKPKAGS